MKIPVWTKLSHQDAVSVGDMCYYGDLLEYVYRGNASTFNIVNIVHPSFKGMLVEEFLRCMAAPSIEWGVWRLTGFSKEGGNKPLTTLVRP